MFVIPLNPVNSKILKLTFLGCVVGAWFGYTTLTWKWKPLRVIGLILPLLAAIPFILPGGKIDANELSSTKLFV